jgi:nucleoporin NUP82
VPTSPTKTNSPSLSDSHVDDAGAKRLIAQRGTELFVAIGNKLRWTDLAQVKDRYEDTSRSRKDEPAYKTVGFSTFYAIRQLVISPSEQYLAVATDFTVHVIPLPDHASFSTPQRPVVKVRAMQLGPTTHVIPGSPIKSVLWHPLAAASASTDCLITVTADASLRLWEIDRRNRTSVEQPALDIDLRKLADGLSSDQDFRPVAFGKSKGFSVDDVDMEVSACCFGGRGDEDENPWASMTLWAAMRNGDVYALCPLLPATWQPTTTTIPALSTSTVSKMATIGEDSEGLEERRAIEQQYEWVSEIDSDEPVSPDDESGPEIRLRPSNPSAVPRLQGPFELGMDDDEEFDVTDLYVMAPGLEKEDRLDEDAEDEIASNHIPYTVLVLGTSDSRLHTCLELEGVTGQWLPKKAHNTFVVPENEGRDLVHAATIELKPASDLTSVILTPDIINRSTLFATVGSQVYSVSLDDWAKRIGEEVFSDTDADDRLQTRLATACQSQVAVVDTVLNIKERLPESLSAPVVIDDLDVGYILLTTSSPYVFGSTFDQAHIRSMLLRQSSALIQSPSILHTAPGAAVEPPEDIDYPPSRQIYEPPSCLDHSAEYMINRLKAQLPKANRTILTQKPLRLSPAVFDLMVGAHRTVSGYTSELEQAGAELFRRCERLREELGEQVRHMTELADRLQRIKDQADGDEVRPGEEKKDHETRLQDIKQKQAGLKSRFDDLRRKAGQASSNKKPLSAKEIAWFQEVESIGERIGQSDEDEPKKGSLAARFASVSPPPGPAPSIADNPLQAQQLSQKLTPEAKVLQEKSQAQSPDTPSLQRQNSSDLASSRSSIASRRSGVFPLVSAQYQKERIQDVQDLVERETAVIDAATRRLEGLKLASGLA